MKKEEEQNVTGKRKGEERQRRLYQERFDNDI